MPTEQPVEREIATALSLVVGLSDNMQITFQSGFTADETDAAINERLDRLVALATRQKAIAEIPKIEDDLLKQREDLSQFEEDLARINADHDHAQARRKVELDERIRIQPEERKRFEAEINGKILEMQQARQSTLNAGQEEAIRSGRTGAYKPQGHVKVNLERIDQEIERAKTSREGALEDFDRAYEDGLETMRGEIAKADAERDQAVRNCGISIKRYQDAIAVSTEKLAKAKAAAGG